MFVVFCGTSSSCAISSSLASAKRPEGEGRGSFMFTVALEDRRGDSSLSGCGSKFAMSTFPGQPTHVHMQR